MKIKDRLRELRTSQQLTLRNLSESTGLSVSYLSDVERGRTNPSLKTIETIAKGFDIPVSSFLYGVEFNEEASLNELPEGLKQLFEDIEYKNQLNSDWIDLLNKIQMRGKRPETKQDWLELYLHLKRILGD